MRYWKRSIWTAVIFPTVVVWAADGSAPVTDAAARTAADREVSRFEGYLYLDIDGTPLPIQSDAEIERFLADAEVIEMSLIGTGITIPRKVVLQGDGFRAHAVFKDVNVERHKVREVINGRSRFSLDWCDSHRFETAAYRLDRLLGLDRVPPAVPRRIGGETGTIRIWLERTVNERTRSRKLDVDPPDSRRWHQQYLLMRLFDNLVANRDSNLGNLLIDSNWRLWFIDCTRCFGKTRAMYIPIDKFEHCERGFWEGLKALDTETATEALSPYLEAAEIDALMERRDVMLKHFQELIEERGEARVLFEVVPPSVTAPWGDD